VIRLEIGALAAWTLAKEVSIEPYAAECYPKAFEQKETIVLTAAAARTFWEKVTILHHEANRPENLPMPERYSRHYYDLYCIAHSENKKSAFDDIELLRRVVQFKMKFYPRKWAQYEMAVPGKMKLIPPYYRWEALRKDYENMSEMMFAESPSFDELMTYILELETEINQL
ncbi:MAG: nucleotidyl transferase AbiEii/AbiGii toxin family protein, partial [Clostridium sp.]